MVLVLVIDESGVSERRRVATLLIRRGSRGRCGNFCFSRVHGDLGAGEDEVFGGRKKLHSRLGGRGANSSQPVEDLLVNGGKVCSSLQEDLDELAPELRRAFVLLRLLEDVGGEGEGQVAILLPQQMHDRTARPLQSVPELPLPRQPAGLNEEEEGKAAPDPVELDVLSGGGEEVPGGEREHAPGYPVVVLPSHPRQLCVGYELVEFRHHAAEEGDVLGQEFRHRPCLGRYPRQSPRLQLRFLP
eukprot:766696-Hanusia_phi.AAC.10